MSNLTNRERKTLAAVLAYAKANGRAPTIDEIAAELKWSRSYVIHDTKALVEAGWIMRGSFRTSPLIPVDRRMRQALKSLRFIAGRLNEYPRFQEDLRRVVSPLELEVADSVSLSPSTPTPPGTEGGR